MKTPREILFQRHNPGDTKLDALRDEIVADLSRQMIVGATPLSIRLILALWDQIIWPARRVWAGLACCWVIIAALNFAAREDAVQIRAEAPIAPSPETLEALHEQRLLYAELIGRPPPGSRNAPRSFPALGPHSQRRDESATV